MPNAPGYFADWLAGLTSTELAEVRAALELRSAVDMLAQSGAAVVAPINDTAENILATISLAAGFMGVNDAIELTTLWSFTGSTNLKTMRARLGGIGGTAFLAAGRNTLTEITLQQKTIIRNRNSLASQVGYTAAVTTAFGVGTQAVLTGTINMANAQDLVITGQKATGTETITLEAYSAIMWRA